MCKRERRLKNRENVAANQQRAPPKTEKVVRESASMASDEERRREGRGADRWQTRHARFKSALFGSYADGRWRTETRCAISASRHHTTSLLDLTEPLLSSVSPNPSIPLTRTCDDLGQEGGSFRKKAETRVSPPCPRSPTKPELSEYSGSSANGRAGQIGGA